MKPARPVPSDRQFALYPRDSPTMPAAFPRTPTAEVPQMGMEELQSTPMLAAIRGAPSLPPIQMPAACDGSFLVEVSKAADSKREGRRRKTPASVGCAGTAGPATVVPGLQYWAPIARIGSIGSIGGYCIGASVHFVAATSGRLYTTINDDVFGDNWGGVTVAWTITRQP